MPAQMHGTNVSAALYSIERLVAIAASIYSCRFAIV